MIALTERLALHVLGADTSMPADRPDPQRNTATVQQIKQISSAQLLGPRGELVIIHNEERYTLRITANQKLILTK